MGILDGKAAIVTGGARGIGRGHCLHLAQNGASVVVNDIDGDEAQKVVGEISAAGGKAVINTDDISKREGAQSLVGQCVDAFGGIHAVVNNAGNVRDRSFLKMSDEELLQTYADAVGERALLRHAMKVMDEAAETRDLGDHLQVRSALRVLGGRPLWSLAMVQWAHDARGSAMGPRCVARAAGHTLQRVLRSPWPTLIT